MFSLKKAALSACIALAAVIQLIPAASAQNFTYVNPGYALNALNMFMPYAGNYRSYGYGYNPYSYSYGMNNPLYGYNNYNAYNYGGYPGGYYGGYGYPGAYAYSGYPTGAYVANTAIGLGLNLLQTGLYYRNYRNAYRGYNYYY